MLRTPLLILLAPRDEPKSAAIRIKRSERLLPDYIWAFCSHDTSTIVFAKVTLGLQVFLENDQAA